MEFEKEIAEIRTLFLGIINEYNTIEKTPRNYGTGELLYASEMNIIETLGYNQGINVTDLAEKLGVTKGAISQVIKKLEKKNLVSRFREPGNNREVLLKLTIKGEIAFHQHELFHLQFSSKFFEEIEKWTPEEIAFLKNVLKSIFDLFEKALDTL